ncbi:BTB/POZ domain-containing protein 1-like isoform X2 [Amblyomma americanum]
MPSIKDTTAGAPARVINMAKYLNSPALSDAEFVIRTGNDPIPRTISVHKQFLAMRNEVLYELLFESHRGDTKFYVDDLHPDGFYGLLKYLYSGTFCANSFEEVMLTRIAAKRYKELGLENACSKYIAEHLTVDNLCPLLDCLNTRDIGLIDKPAIAMLKNSGASVLRSDTFVDSLETTMHVILDVVAGVPENLVVDALRRWAEKKCEKDLYADGTAL